MGATASRAMEYSLMDIFGYIQESGSRVVSYKGWNGVGISTAAKVVAKAAEESKLFDVVVLVKAGEKCSPWKLQRRIAEQLGIVASDDVDYSNEEEEEEDERSKAIHMEVARRIHESLLSRKFLLIVDKLLLLNEKVLELTSMGIPALSPWSRCSILITTPYQHVTSAMKSDRVFQLSYVARNVWPNYGAWRKSLGKSLLHEVEIIAMVGVDNLLEHFRDEAGDVANNLLLSSTSSGASPQVSVDEVFNCFIYLLLFQKAKKTSIIINEKEVTKYYVGEGFVKERDLEAAFKVGEAVLQEMISRSMVDKSPFDDDGKLVVNSHLWEILEEWLNYLQQHLLHIQLDATRVLEDDAKWISLVNNNDIQTLLFQAQQLNYENPRLSTLLLYDNPQLTQIPDNFFHGIPNLKVLDLSGTAVSSLPPSLSSLVHLRFLKLRECYSLNSLPPTLLNDLKQLVILDLHATPISAIPAEAFQHKRDLRLLDLSHTNILSLPSSLLSSLCNLEQLFLRGCGSSTFTSSSEGLGSGSLQILDLSYSPKLKCLPTSITNLTSLKKLLLAECNALEDVMPSQLRQLSALEEVDISGCGALKDVENVSLEDMPKLRAISLGNNKIARLSLTRCPMLENVHLQGLANLKWLHLSSIKIKEFPCEISEMKCLEQLQLTDVQHLKKVDWAKVHWLPEKLEWDECGCSITSALQAREHAKNRDNDKASSAFISVSNAKIFRDLGPYSPIWRNSLSKFHIRISPCWKQYEKKEKEKRAVVDIKRRKPLVYAGIHSKINPNFKKHKNEEELRDFGRYLEIEGVDDVLHLKSIKNVAQNAEVLSLRENRFQKSLALELGLEFASAALKECRVERCQNIEHLFPEYPNRPISWFTGMLWVSDMERLRSVHDGGSDFQYLKHLHIECCPKLHILFGADTYLIDLETLHIRFCPRLESFFNAQFYSHVEVAFPRLRCLHLWELPKLYEVGDESLPPSLQKLRVGACPKLQRLPLLRNPLVKIEGESDWWSNLKWDNQRKINKEAINFQSKQRQ